MNTWSEGRFNAGLRTGKLRVNQQGSSLAITAAIAIVHTPAQLRPVRHSRIHYGAFQTLRQPVSRIHQEAMAPNTATAASSSSPAR